MRKAVDIVLVAALLVLLLGGCAGNPGGEEDTQEKTVQIGMIFDTFVVERWQKDRDVFAATVQELGGSVDIQNANGDVQNQIDQMEYFIQKKVDVIVIVPIDSSVIASYVKKAHKAGIKVISYDRIVADAGTDLYISFDNRQVGRLMADSLQAVLTEDDPVLMINGPQSDPNVFGVSEGFEEELHKTGAQILDICYIDGWKAEKAGEYIEQNLDLVRQAKAIMCGNDHLAGQVIQKLAEYQLSEDIYVVGQDADLDACQRIVEGSQYMTVYKAIDNLAKEAARAAMLLAQGGKPVTDVRVSDGSYEIPSLMLPPEAVTKENMDEVIVESGFHLKKEVYLNRQELIR